MATIYTKHENWTSRFTFLMAAVGAAVGLGNIWKFPYVAGQSGGSAFVLVYLIAVAFVALPILIAEIMLGRWGKQSPPNAMANVAHSQKRSKHWSLLGWTGMLTAYLIATYYSVISGWAVAYIFKNGGGTFSGQDASAIAAEFDAFLADPAALTTWHAIFMVIVTLIMVRGLQAGLEKTVKYLMPSLFVLLLVMVGWVFFYAADLDTALVYLSRLVDFGETGIGDEMFKLLTREFWVIFLLACITFLLPGQYVTGLHLAGRVPASDSRFVLKTAYSVVAMALCILYVTVNNFSPFLYFQF